MHILLIPDKIVPIYGLKDLADAKEYVYVEVRRGMYGLPQAGIIANKQLEKFLQPLGYYQSTKTPRLWLHMSKQISFMLIVDDFFISYTNRKDADQLKQALQRHYKNVAVLHDDMLTYSGIKFQWDYQACMVYISMPNYVQESL